MSADMDHTWDPEDPNLTFGYAGWDLTFGIELEFVVAYQVEPYAKFAQLDIGTHVRAQLIEFLQDAGVYEINQLEDRTDYSFWTVGADGSIKAEPHNPYLPDWKGSEFVGIELKTPRLYYTDSADAFEQLTHVVDAVKARYATFTNESCGLHIHVGNCDGGFPLRTVKTLAQLFVAYERQMSSIHPPHRVRNVHCRPPSCNFSSKDLSTNLNTLEVADDWETLIGYMSCNPAGSDRGFAYNFTNLLTEDEVVPATIEFRQHEATLNMAAISAWTPMVCGLVTRCHELDHSIMRQVLSNGLTPTPPDLIQLIRSLDLQEAADYYSRRIRYHHPESDGTFDGEAWLPDPDADVEMTDDNVEQDSNVLVRAMETETVVKYGRNQRTGPASEIWGQTPVTKLTQMTRPTDSIAPTRLKKGKAGDWEDTQKPTRSLRSRTKRNSNSQASTAATSAKQASSTVDPCAGDAEFARKVALGLRPGTRSSRR